jgi:uncharacterized iron-regulated protein
VTPREEIGSLQRRLFRRQRRLIAGSVHGMTSAFRAYERRYRARVRGFQREAAYAELLEEVADADLVYVGDYHTLKQSQRSFLKIVQRRRRPAILALEFVQGRHQRALDDWLAGKLSDGRLLERIEYRRHHAFDVWPNFRPILEEARRNRLPCVAIDLIGTRSTSLRERDAYAARRIAAGVRESPEAQLYALAGQLHVAKPHLPAAVDRELSPEKRRSLSIYQNCEAIYWALQDGGRELEVEAALVRPGEWCLVNTPPVVVQASFLAFVEGGHEPLESADPEARFRELALAVARFLRLDDENFRAALSEVAVYTAGDLGFLETLPARGFAPAEIRLIERQILARESYYIPRARIAYLADLSVNHAAEEATHFLRHVASGAMDEPRGLVDGFYARTLEEAYAFCGSKIVNPRRKCPHEPEFERLARGRSRFERILARAVLDHRRVERGRRSPGALRRLHAAGGPVLFNAVTHALGYMLGERLYYALVSGRMPKSDVRELFLDPLAEEGAAFLTYFDLSKRLAGVRIPPRA